MQRGSSLYRKRLRDLCERRLPGCCRRQLADEFHALVEFLRPPFEEFFGGLAKRTGWHHVLPRNACAILSARGVVRLPFGACCLEAKNCFAFLHQIQAIARDRFQIRHVRLEQVDLARLAGEQTLLFVHLLLEVVDLGAAPHQFFIRRNKQAHDY
jgi:hypothetical protein